MTINELKKKLEAKISNALEEVAKHLTESVRAAAPVDTGELRDSVDYEQESALEFQVMAGTDHCVYVEFGTVAHPPNPFFRRTMSDEQDRMSQIFKEACEA